MKMVWKTDYCSWKSIFWILLIIGSIHIGHSFKLKIKHREPPKYLRTCYYPLGEPEPALLNATLCTHIICGFETITDGILNITNKKDINQYLATTALKAKHPNLKVMLSIGGGGAGGFSTAVGSTFNRTKLIISVIKYLIKFDFDGLDIDWEFPVWNSGIKSDKENFVYFLREFRLVTGQYCGKPYILSIAVGAVKSIIDEGYDVPNIAKYVDFINLMSYDYHDYRPYTPFTGHNSPLFNRSVEKAYFSTLNTAWSANYWLKLGMPRKKILIGLPTYGHTFKLLDSSMHGLDAPAVDVGIGDGTITFPQACEFLKKGGKRVFDKESQIPYAYQGLDWIGYDDYDSITSKVQWVKSQGFGGVMTFDLTCDDWQKVCDGETAFPLHQLIYRLLTS